MRNSLTFTRKLFYGVLVACVLAAAPAGAQEAQPEIRQLLIGVATERKVVGQEVHIYAAELKRGQVLRVSFQEKGADVGAVVMLVIDPQKDSYQKASAASNYGTGFMRESLTLIPDQDGTYALVVRAQQATDAGVAAGYELTTSLSEAAGPRDIQRAQAERLLEEAGQALVSSDAKSALSAVSKVEESITIWRALGDRYFEAIAETILGGAYMASKDYAKAEMHLLAAVKIFEEVKNEPGIASVYAALGGLYLASNDKAKATVYLTRAAEISRKLGDRRVESVLGIANVGEASSEPTEEDARNYEAELLAARGKKDKRAEVAVWARTVFHYALGGEDLVNEVKGPLVERAEREALPLLWVVRDRDAELKLRLGLAICFYDLTLSPNTDEDEDLRNRSKSMKYLRQALVLARVQNDPTMQIMAYLHLGVYYEGDNERLAIFVGKKVINALQQFRQDSRMFDKETQQEIARASEEGYGELASALLLESRLPEAQQVLNFARDQEFFDLQLTQNPQRARLALSPREAESERMFDGAIESIAAKYGGNRDADFVTAGEELKAAFETLEKNFSAPQSVDDVARDVTDTADMQAALRELSAKTGRRHAALYIVEDMTEVLLITPEAIKYFMADATSGERWSRIQESIQKARNIEELMKQQPVGTASSADEEVILEFLKVLRRPDYDPRPLGAQIYRTIFKAKELVSGKHTDQTLEAELAASRVEVLLWSLSGNLRYVPMGALYDADHREYLIEKYQNAVFTRARKERFLVEPKPWTQGVGFGTSTAYPGFASLPGVVNEVSAIFGDPARGQKGLFSGRVFLNQAFTRQVLLTLQQSKPPLVHIASHFKFQPGDSRNSFLLLGDGDRFSLLDMQQNALLFAGVDLLTLSACETAAQQAGADGKEVDGFAELAQRLGASSVIATLWKVNDNGTSRLMTEFYRLRQENPGAPKSEILRQAQLNLLNGKNTAEASRRMRRSRGTTEVAETDEEKSRIPFTPSAEAPFEHPYYWAPFVLFGSSR